jgi:alkanesulfonate monooxygenase SsuD/methylene tetrahydromethanopterin reductase-like flavin-dependent oxidoreductase (luciferase family)
VILAAVAQATALLRLGTSVTPLPRRRPQVLASTLSTLDRLSQGRVIFGAGLGGVAEEFTAFGEPGDARQRAQRLDEGLGLLRRLWAGQT